MIPQQQSHAGAGVAQITNEADYSAALAEIEPLMVAKPGTPEFARFDVLATRIQAYERIHYPIDPPTPEAIAQYEREKRVVDLGGWIACSDRLPEDDVHVLVWDGDCIDLCFLWSLPSGARLWHFGTDMELATSSYVTHWRELPPPPNPIT